MSSNKVVTGRNARQHDFIPPDSLNRCHAVIAGVGSVGRQVALQLAAMGIPSRTLYDPDTVSEENLGCQGSWETDVGDPKVNAVANVCHQQFPKLELHARAERFRKSAVKDWPRNRVHAVFLAVDSMETRRLIWGAVKRTAGIVVDGRMAAEIIRLPASDHPAGNSSYPRTLFPGREAFEGSCTSKSTIYGANIAAGLMLGQFSRWLRGLPIIPDQTLNLLAGELTIVEGE